MSAPRPEHHGGVCGGCSTRSALCRQSAAGLLLLLLPFFSFSFFFLSRPIERRNVFNPSRCCCCLFVVCVWLWHVDAYLFYVLVRWVGVTAGDPPPSRVTERASRQIGRHGPVSVTGQIRRLSS